MRYSIIVITAILLLTTLTSFGQRDIIYKKDSTKIRCQIVKETNESYRYLYLSFNQKVLKGKIQKALVDSVNINFYDSNLVKNKYFQAKVKSAEETEVEKKKNWIFTTGIGINIGNLLEFNNPTSSDKKSFSSTLALDLGLYYAKEKSQFTMSNEIHWLLALQKDGLTGSSYIQRASDDFRTLHDISYAITKSSKWNFNVILKTTTSIFNIYDGDFFSDVNRRGKIQSFLSPYSVSFSPGIKWEYNKYLRVSLSPYSFNLYGVQNQQVSNKGIFISELNASGKYKNFLFKRLGADLNIWYDRRVKSWLDIQYRVGISSNYFEKVFKNGLLDGLFITKIKLYKNIYLTHRGAINADFSMSTFKPYYSQTILLNFNKSF